MARKKPKKTPAVKKPKPDPRDPVEEKSGGIGTESGPVEEEPTPEQPEHKEASPPPDPMKRAEERYEKTIAKRRCEKCGQTGCYTLIKLDADAADVKCRGCQSRYRVKLVPSR